MSDKRLDYISWDEYFMGVAFLSAMRSKDPTHRWAPVLSARTTRFCPWAITDFPGGCSDDEFPWKREGDPLDNKYFIRPTAS